MSRQQAINSTEKEDETNDHFNFDDRRMTNFNFRVFDGSQYNISHKSELKEEKENARSGN